jgi:soluble lytic murein transglycosylase
MQSVEIYPTLRTSRANRNFPVDQTRSRAASINLNGGKFDLLDRLGFALFVTSAVFLIIVLSFYVFAKQPDSKAKLFAFNDIDLALSPAESFFPYEFDSTGPKVIKYQLPNTFAAIKSDPRVASQYNQYLVQVRFISRLIQKITKKNAGTNLAQIIVKESKKHGYDPLFVTAVIMAESGFNKKAISSVGALGLMQLLPTTAKYISVKLGENYWKGHRPLLHDESYNINLGVTYLKYLDAKFGGDKKLTLAAYNWGPGNLERSLKRGSNKLPPETQRYRDSILRNYSKWTSEFRQQQAQNAKGNNNYVG